MRLSTAGKSGRAVLEVVQRRQRGGLDEVAEERGGGGVGGDAGGDDDPGPAERPGQGAVELGEDGVGVDVPAAAERVAARRCAGSWLSPSARRSPAW